MTAQSSNEKTVKAQSQIERAQRRREDAVRRLVIDVTRLPSTHPAANAASDILKPSLDETNNCNGTIHPLLENSRAGDVPTASQASVSGIGAFTKLPEDSLLTSAVAVSIERGIDRELHNELVRQARESAGVISKICHDHSDAFLGSVGRVVALGGPCGELRGKIEEVRARGEDEVFSNFFSFMSGQKQYFLLLLICTSKIVINSTRRTRKFFLILAVLCSTQHLVWRHRETRMQEHEQCTGWSPHAAGLLSC